MKAKVFQRVSTANVRNAVPANQLLFYMQISSSIMLQYNLTQWK